MKMNSKLDERQQQIQLKTFRILGIFLLICIGFMGYYKMYKYNTVPYEFYIVLIAFLILYFAPYLYNDIPHPQDTKGNYLPTSSSRTDVKVRIKHYFQRSFEFSLYFSILDILLLHINTLALNNLLFLTLLFTIGISFCIAFPLNILLGEFQIKKYNKLIQKLDEDDK